MKDIQKIEKKNSIGISVFGYENKKKIPIYVSKKMLWRKTCWFTIDRTRKQITLCFY